MDQGPLTGLVEARLLPAAEQGHYRVLCGKPDRSGNYTCGFLGELVVRTPDDQEPVPDFETGRTSPQPPQTPVLTLALRYRPDTDLARRFEHVARSFWRPTSRMVRQLTAGRSPTARHPPRLSEAPLPEDLQPGQRQALARILGQAWIQHRIEEFPVVVFCLRCRLPNRIVGT